MIDIKYNIPIFLDEFSYANIIHRIYFVKVIDTSSDLDHYFLKLYTRGKQNNLCLEGYLYFFADFTKKEGKYIGTFIKEECRGLGLASILMAYWIKFSLEHDLINLKTNLTQRKPFLLYILKKYAFEIPNHQQYKISPNTIFILDPLGTKEKRLYFKNSKQRDTFKRGKIIENDNYFIVDDLENQIILDEVLLSTPYQLQDENKAYERARTHLR